MNRCAVKAVKRRAILDADSESGTLALTGGGYESILESSGIGLLDQGGHPRAGLTMKLFKNEPALMLEDQTAAEMTVLRTGSLHYDAKNGTRALYDAEGLRLWRNSQPAADFGVNEGGSLLGFYDRAGKPRTLLSLDKDEPALEFVDQSGTTRAVIGNASLTNSQTGSTENTGPSSVILFGKNGHVVWRAP